MTQRQTISEAWFVAVMAQFSRLGIELNDQHDTAFNVGSTATPRYLQLVHMRRVWHQAFERCPDPYLGLKVGCNLPLQAMNILAIIIMHSGTLHQALNNIARYHPLVSSSGRFQLRHADDGGAILDYEVTDCVVPMHPAQMDSVFAGAITLLSRCMPEMVGHLAVELPGTGTRLENGYAGYLNCKVRLGSARGRMSFPGTIIDRPWLGADSPLLASVCDVADRRLRALGYARDLVGQVKALITSTGFAETDLTHVAEALGMSRRSFQRRLADAETNFRQLVEATRLEQALELLNSSDLPVYRIAEAVGYAEPSALSHVMKRRLGKTPKQLRQELKQRLSIPATTKMPPSALSVHFV